MNISVFLVAFLGAMTSSHRVRVACLTLANLLLPLAVLVFAAGFFPYKPVLPGLADWEDGDEARESGGPGAHAPFNKVIFMVVDALRSDFVFGEESAMSFVQRSVWIRQRMRSVTDSRIVWFEMALPYHSPRTQHRRLLPCLESKPSRLAPSHLSSI